MSPGTDMATGGSAGGAGHGVGPGAGLGSVRRHRCGVWACPHSLAAIVTVTFANCVRTGGHDIKKPVFLFDRSTVSPSRPGFRGAPRAAAVKTGRSAAQATAAGGAKRS